ncbi:peptidyl-prolyl cis-trans isomerase, cyclophilin-type [Gleimia coleocanis DSM 15436]|uniref:Peptidyl-prolyl cis-trans isomerase n=1 Tax=Gleimia coleocanis DSM 15436 TaxID=525245 RepID=C0VY13_9ACTO|nr:peptidylprolyl isomerase [Gleimia coleocanis]EEH64316.1 peptidyl-prolyl cis-trans isomerase, cyclophilin-type [Gleimia coleocanis DSM 15436]
MKATIETTLGVIRLELFPEHAPVTVKNFVDLARGNREWVHPATGETMNEPLYDGVIFHRVIPGFMIQGGDPLGLGIGGPGYNFDDEIHPELKFDEPYLLAMANAGKRMGKGTNGSQFFITVAATPWLNGNHTIFGKVIDEDSKRVVDEIANVRTGANDRPLEDVAMLSVEIED